MIALLEPAAADDAVFVTHLAELVNAVYAVAEEGLWQPGAQRTTPEEIASFVRAGEIAVNPARTGMVRLHDVAPDTAEFGLLVSAPSERNTGIGRALLDFAEDHSRAAGRTTMQLELLVPRAFTHPSKAFLKDWYGRRGYRLVRKDRFEDGYAHLAPLLATPCDLEVHAKAL
jgi:GNAT superfamily N-acetyltransferase